MKRHIKTPTKGYHLSEEGIRQIEQQYGGKYMGYWCTIAKGGGWTYEPIDVFYTPNPDLSKGHSHYFGILIRDGVVYITNASPVFSQPIYGVLCDDGEVIVSRYRHDCVVKGNHMVDGGRDYTRSSINSPMVRITVDGPKFKFRKEKRRNG
jgi:hypothetical protein